MPDPPKSDIDALRVALDALNNLHVAIKLVHERLASLQRNVSSWRYVVHFEKRSGKFLGVSSESKPDEIEWPADHEHCIEIASDCEWLPKYVDDWKAILGIAEKAHGGYRILGLP